MNKTMTWLVALLWAAAVNAQSGMDTRLITIEEHFTDPQLTEADARWRPKTELTDEQREVMAFFASRMNLTEQLGDLSEKRIPHMDSQGIRMQILSYTSLTDEQKQLIAHKNAERLYRLKK